VHYCSVSVQPRLLQKAARTTSTNLLQQHCKARLMVFRPGDGYTPCASIHTTTHQPDQASQPASCWCTSPLLPTKGTAHALLPSRSQPCYCKTKAVVLLFHCTSLCCSPLLLNCLAQPNAPVNTNMQCAQAHRTLLILAHLQLACYCKAAFASDHMGSTRTLTSACASEALCMGNLIPATLRPHSLAVQHACVALLAKQQAFAS
jgi:hypothetical protein